MQKFLFDTSFDPEKEDTELLDQREDPEEAYARGEKDGFTEGYALGFQAGQMEERTLQGRLDSQKISEILERITQHCQSIQEQCKTLGVLAAKIIQSCLIKLFPPLCKRMGKETLQDFVIELLEKETVLPVRFVTSPSTAQWLEKHLVGWDLQEVIFEKDPELSDTDIRVFWQEKGVERIQKKLLDGLQEFLEQISKQPLWLESSNHSVLDPTIETISEEELS